MSTSTPAAEQTCIYCHRSKPLSDYRPIGNRLNKTCTRCLDIRKATKDRKDLTAANIAKGIATPPAGIEACNEGGKAAPAERAAGRAVERADIAAAAAAAAAGAGDAGAGASDVGDATAADDEDEDENGNDDEGGEEDEDGDQDDGSKEHTYEGKGNAAR